MGYGYVVMISKFKIVIIKLMVEVIFEVNRENGSGNKQNINADKTDLNLKQEKIFLSHTK